MDKDQKEFTDQIRSAIKAKLAELNALVDDELPDYIMILIANKRSKSQIIKDLDLFLGDETSKFTDWLCDMVQSCKLKGKSSAAKKDEVKKKIKKESEDDNDVLNCGLSDQGSDLEEDVKSDKNNKVITKPTRVNDAPLPPKAIQEPTSQQKYSNTAFTSLEFAQAPQPEDEYDPTKPHISGCMSSVVHVSQKNYGRPASLQPNKLLLRAVNDATKSILHGQNVNDYYKPTPIDVLSLKKQNFARHRNLVNVKIDPGIEHLSTPSTLENASYDENNELDAYLERELPLTHPTSVNSELGGAMGFAEEANYSFDLNDSEIPEDQQVVNSTHFIVTLDGVDYSLKRKFSETSEEAMDVDEEEGLTEDSLGSKRVKLPVKCKYWPSCKNSYECAFHHPNVPCNTFPDCKYGDQCKYIHPDCKFDALCSRKDCPYTHASKRSFPLKPAVKKSIQKRGVKTVCKFYPKCTSTNCPFIHPKPCRYGNKCQSSVCPFTHYNIPSRNQLIWKASV